MIEKYYNTFKILHIISMISWMAGLLYLPRIYVYHSTTLNSDTDKIFQVMEKRLLRIIMNPAMIATIVFGLLLAYIYRSFGLWFHLKMLFVLVLCIFHMMLAKWRKDFEKGQNKHSPGFYRFCNEIPTLCMIFIVILVVLKP